LIPDFVTAMRNHGNALQAMLLYMQDTWNELYANEDVKYALNAKLATTSELLAAGYNSNAAKLPGYIRRGNAGWKTLTLSGRSDAKYTFRAAMGAPTNISQETLVVAGEQLPVVIMTMANPQCVTLVNELPDRARFEKLGPALATHPRFAAGTNVEFAVVDGPNRVRILIWERGVGPTHASGTGACASAVAAAVAGGAGRDIDVEAPGGTQRVEWHEDGVYLTGWAEVLFDGLWVPR